MSTWNEQTHGKPSDRTTLDRGKACFNCRRRKMRCDGVHPICGQCSRANRPDDCEYTNGQRRAQAEILQENISRVESRIHELQHPQPPQAGISLHQPYQFAPTNFPPEIMAQSFLSQSSSGNASEPSGKVIANLIDSFLPHASEFDFFLNPTRFRQSALMSYPGDRPSPCLVWTVCLCALRLSKLPNLIAQEAAFLSRALELTTNGLISNHPHKIIHTMQSEVLLSYFFFASGRFLEGKYHTSVAISIGIGCSLHMIRSGSSNQLPPSRDSTEQGERIHAFWTTLILDQLWAAALNQNASIDFGNTKAEPFRFELLWPLEVRDYEVGHMSSAAIDCRNIQQFLSGVNPTGSGISTFGVLAKAAMLWKQVDILSREWQPSYSFPKFVCTSRPPAQHFSQHLRHFRSGICIVQPTPAMARALVVAHSIAHAATVQLHSMSAVSADPNSRRKRVSSARSALHIIEAVPRSAIAYINPIMGTVWICAYQALLDGNRGLKLKRLGRMGEHGEGLPAILMRAVVRISSFAETCPLLKYQIAHIQEACRAM